MGGESRAFMAVCLVVVLAAASPLVVQGQIIDRVSLTDTICCTPSGTCSFGETGLPNVTSTLRCLNVLTGALMVVGTGVSNDNGTINISAPIPRPFGSLIGIIPGRPVPCLYETTISLANQAACPVLNVVNNTIPTALLAVVVSSTTGVVTGVLTP